MTTREMMARASETRGTNNNTAPAFSPGERYRSLGTRKMSFEEWLTMPDCRVQRDHVSRAPRAWHLHSFDPTHREVVMAILPDGRTFKVDGHTRAECWARGFTPDLPASLTLEVKVWLCRDIDAVRQLYRRYDNPLSADDATDTLFGTLRDTEIELKSAMMKRCQFTSVLRQLYIWTKGPVPKHMDGAQLTQEMMLFLRDEIVAFDRLDPPSRDYVTPIMCAALLTFLLDPDSATEFWRAYNENTGTKTARGVDGVQAARNVLAYVRKNKMQNTRCAPEIVGRALNAFQSWQRGRRYGGNTRNKDGLPEKKTNDSLRDFIDRAIEAKRLRLGR